jgi:hypothetical protein
MNKSRNATTRAADRRSPPSSSDENIGIHEFMRGAIIMAALSDALAHTLARAVLRLDVAERAASESDRLGQRMASRENRRAVAAAQRELDEAIALAREVRS